MVKAVLVSTSRSEELLKKEPKYTVDNLCREINGFLEPNFGKSKDTVTSVIDSYDLCGDSGCFGGTSWHPAMAQCSSCCI